MELWLVCALLTVVCYGVGEGLSREPTVRLGSARMLVLSAVGRAWLAPMIVAIILWGAWGILERMSIDALGFAGNAGIYVIVSTPIYLAVASRGLRESGSWDRAGIREAIPSLFLFSIAGITIFLAIGLGPIAIVVPLTTGYPIVAILVRRFWMDERLTFPQKFAIGLAMVGAFLAAL